MASVNFKKVTPIREVADSSIIINDQEVLVKQYLPVEEKAKMATLVTLASIDENTGISSPIRFEIAFTVLFVKFYSNISITDKMLENIDKTYDDIMMNDLYLEVAGGVPQDELDSITALAQKTQKATVDYNTSFVGSMKIIGSDYNMANMNVDALVDKVKDVGENGIIKDVMERLQ